jgi:oligoendopeptidase F
MISEKVEGMLNTVVRQTAFFTFEQKLHAEYREKGELSPERLGELWRETSRESLGPAVNMDVDGAQHFWAYVPHFIHTPFYVYAYAFGDCLVNTLYDAYDKAADKNDFAQKYAALLSAGGSKSHEALLEPFGFDVNDPAFWRKGLGVIEKYIDELITLDQKIERAAKAEKDIRDAGRDLTESKAPAANDNPPRDNFKKAARKKPPPAGLDSAVPTKPPKKGGGTGGPS